MISTRLASHAESDMQVKMFLGLLFFEVSFTSRPMTLLPRSGLNAVLSLALVIKHNDTDIGQKSENK